MSIKVMTQVWEFFPGGGSDLLALLALADWSDASGRCFPSIAAVAKKTRLSRSQTQRVVHGLIDAGFLVVTHNDTGGKPGMTRRYRIAIERLAGSAHATGNVDATGCTRAQDGPHPCAETGSAHATQTVIEPSMNTKKVGDTSPPRCPHQEIIDLYHEELPDLPRVRLNSKSRTKAIIKLWVWAMTSKKSDGSRRAETVEQGLEWFRSYFVRATKNDFLMGRTQRTREHSSWRCDLDYLMSERGQIQVIEKTFEEGRS